MARGAPGGPRSVIEHRTAYDGDNRDRLRWMRFPEGAKVRFQYDAFGRRISKGRGPASPTDCVAAATRALAEGVDALELIKRIDFVWDGNVLAADVGAVGEAARAAS